MTKLDEVSLRIGEMHSDIKNLYKKVDCMNKTMVIRNGELTKMKKSLITQGTEIKGCFKKFEDHNFQKKLDTKKAGALIIAISSIIVALITVFF